MLQMGQNTVKNKAEQAPLVVLEPATAAGIKLFKLFTIPRSQPIGALHLNWLYDNHLKLSAPRSLDLQKATGSTSAPPSHSYGENQ
jgi:hypothetical protein